eukprot:1196131-Prorocentrum_minimum.AAC.3
MALLGGAMALGGSCRGASDKPDQTQFRGAMLCSEIQALIAIMRQNSKWALVPGYGYGEDELPEDQLLEEFKVTTIKTLGNPTISPTGTYGRDGSPEHYTYGHAKPVAPRHSPAAHASHLPFLGVVSGAADRGTLTWDPGSTLRSGYPG